MKNNKTPEFFCAATTLFVSYTLNAAGIPPISITLSSGAGTNIINTSLTQTNVVEYKLQDAIGRPPSRTWLWTHSALSYLTRTQSLHQPDCSRLQLPLPESFIDLVIGDGCYSMLTEQNYDKLSNEIVRVLHPQDIFSCAFL